MSISTLSIHPEQDFIRVYRATITTIRAVRQATDDRERQTLLVQAHWHAEWALMFLDYWEDFLVEDIAVEVEHDSRTPDRNRARTYLSTFLKTS